MSKNNMNVRYSALTMVAGTIYLLNLTLLCAESSPTPNAAHMKSSNRLNVPPDDIKRVVIKSSSGREKVNADKAIAEVNSQKIGDSNKFQARMMQQEQQLSQGSYYSDSWHPHSLVPTFTDQEQGDEMVALASDSYGAEQSFQSNNRSSFADATPTDKSDHGSMRASNPEKPSLADESLASRAPGSVGNAKMHAPSANEYYSDEEEDEEEQGKIMPGGYDNPSLAYQEHKDVSSQNKFQQNMHRANKHQTDTFQYSDYPDNEGYKKPTIEPVNRTSIKITSAIPKSDKNWLPTTSLNSSDDSQQVGQSETLQQSQFRQSQQRPQKMSDRLSSLLSGRALGKTDVAIEYLKSILESRQNFSASGNQTSSNSSTVKQIPSDSYLDQSTSLQQKIASQVNINREFPIKSLSLISQNSNGKPDKAYDAKDSIDTNIDKAVEKSFLSQQADAKFTINDVKPTPNLDSSLQTQSYQFSTTSLPTSLLNSKPVAQDNRQFLTYQDELSSGNMPNGTPLGGDYIDSLDEYPRGLLGSYLNQGLLQKQHQPHQMFSSESNLSPISQPPDQRPDQSMAQALSIENQSQQYPAILIKSAQSEKMHSNNNPFLTLEQRVPQPEVSTSSRYFQMQQAPSKHGPQIEQKLSEVSTKQETHNDREHHYDDKRKTSPFSNDKNNTSKTDSANNQGGFSKFEDERKHAQHEFRNQAKQTFHDDNQPNQKQQLSISSKIYRDEVSQPQPLKQALNMNSQPPQSQLLQQQHQSQQQPQQPAAIKFLDSQINVRQKPPKIVSYNYFENSSEAGESELMATNYQLGDALYGSNGGIEQLLSQTELEAIQNQFMTAEHPIVPLAEHQQRQHSMIHQSNDQDSSLAGLMSNLKPNNQAESLQKLNSPVKQIEDTMKELASEEDHIRVMGPPKMDITSSHPTIHDLSGKPDDERSRLAGKQIDPDSKKRKSLIVYLNHPRPLDMPEIPVNSDSLSLSQSISEQPADTFISAKEFDSHGLSKDSKHLDVSNLRGLVDIKESQDKDGLSVVVIGDAYKYKKIVLLISSKSGGLKFIPMVKDMKK